MESSGPVLLLPPSSLPTGPIMAPMKVPTPESRLRVVSATPAAFLAAEKSSDAPSKPSLTLHHGLNESAESKAMLEASPVTPSPSVIASALASATGSPTTACSPRDPSSKLAAQASATNKLANAAAIVGLPTSTPSPKIDVPVISVNPVDEVQSLLSPPSIQSPPFINASPAAGGAQTQLQHAGTTTKRATSAAVAKATSPKPVKSNTGRWTEAEHKLFLKGLEQFPYRAWKKIATLIKTRSVVQIRTHAQKYYQKLEKEEQRMREREAQLASQQGHASQRASDISPPSTPIHSSPEPQQPVSAASTLALAVSGDESGVLGKKKAVMRKRKGSTDEPQPPSSLPKRMMKEKKFFREKTMSPKQKAVVSNGKVFGFGDVVGDACSTKGLGSIRGLNGIKSNPLDFDDDSSSAGMILDFADEKPMVEYPFAMESALDHGLAGIDSDDLLQLTDEESLDWFSNTGDQENVVDSAEETKEDAPSPVGSPLNLGRYPFSPLYSEDCLQFADPSVASPIASTVETECSTPSPILTSSADCSDFGLSGDEDDDFVLDPEKFLSSYFSPSPDQS